MGAKSAITADSLYWNEAMIARALGRSLSWWHSNKDRLYAEGFPRKDPIVGLTPRATVEKWVATRAAVSANLSTRGSSAAANPRGTTNGIR